MSLGESKMVASSKNSFSFTTVLMSTVISCVSMGCAGRPVPGPDKQGGYTGVGAIQGAGAGMIIGAQFTAGTGPGAAMGAGFGAVAGAIQGALKDATEEEDIKTGAQIRAATDRVVAQEVLTKHYQQRMGMHPGRDIYPADVFFRGDSAKMCPSGIAVVKEIARLNEFRLPYSRIIVASYAKSSSPESSYVQHLTERRSREFVNQLVRAGMEPRRIETRAVVVDAPVLIDPHDDPTRYNQAIEIIPVDR